MGIAVDQSRLRRIVEHLVPRESIDRVQATTLLEIAQLAAGADQREDPAELAMLQSVAQQIGLKPGEIRPIPPVPDEEARVSWIRALAAQLETRSARELAFALAFLLSVADLELAALETSALEEFQRALDVEDRRAIDLVIFLTETVATET
jgi:hypothetical protein